MKKRYHTLLLLTLALLALCQCTVKEPQAETTVDTTPLIFPDYTGVTIPKNIAPLNFQIKEKGESFVVKVETNGETPILVNADKEGKILLPADKWNHLLQSHSRDSLRFTVYARSEGKWTQYQSFHIKISEEEIDRYVTFRLIEPSYMSSGRMGLYQYDLEKSQLSEILTNHRAKMNDNLKEQCCTNCHYSQKQHPENKMFYYRGPTGGLVLTYNGEIKKINTKVPGLPGGTVYGCWHPTLPYIAFSSNIIRQSFPNTGAAKVYAYDYFSNLVLYDVEKNELTDIIKTHDAQETFPHWSADGKTLYFCSSDSCIKVDNTDLKNIESMKYDLKKIEFNPETKEFGKVQDLYNATEKGRSAMHPRLSHDDRFILFTVSNFGPNAYTQKDAEIFLMDKQTGETRNLEEVNSEESDCYHSWSSNSNWFVFVSRRDDGNYGRLYFSYIDSTGKASKPFAMPHEDPLYDVNLMKSYNAPELSNSPVVIPQSDFEDLIFKTEAIPAKYNTLIHDTIDAVSGASTIIK